MPYRIKGKCVYNKNTGKKVGCTKGSVKKYLNALHANVKENLFVNIYEQVTSSEDIPRKWKLEAINNRHGTKIPIKTVVVVAKSAREAFLKFMKTGFKDYPNIHRAIKNNDGTYQYNFVPTEEEDSAEKKRSEYYMKYVKPRLPYNDN